MSRALVGRLHLLTDERPQARWSPLEIATAAVAGGADVVQFRDKRSLTAEQRIEIARALVARCAGTEVRCIVNDEPVVAAAASAAGVHLGSQDVSPQIARKLIGEQRLIGVTANSLDEARARAVPGVDYLGVGPVFGTFSKASPAPRMGLKTLRQIVEAVDCPVIAIGGIDASNVAEVIACGVHGVAVLSAVSMAEDPRATVEQLRDAIAQGAGC